MPYTMIVDLLDEEGLAKKDGVAFLKLFDRRFSDGLRRHSRAKPWTKDIELVYVDWAKSSAIAPFLTNLRTDDAHFSQTRQRGLNEAEAEALVAYELGVFFDKEVVTYEAMLEHQGSLIPKLKAVVDLAMETPTSVGYQITVISIHLA